MSFLKESNISIFHYITLVVFITILFVVSAGISIYKQYNKFQDESLKLKAHFLQSQKDILIYETDNLINYINYHANQKESILKDTIKSEVDRAYIIMSEIYNNYRDTKSKDEIISMMRVALNGIRFANTRGYIVLNDMNSNMVSYPPNRSFEGKNAKELIDLISDIFLEFSKVVTTKKEGFLTYKWYKPNENILKDKIAFVKLFEPYNLIISAGDYLEDVESDIKNYVLKRIETLRFGKDGYFSIYKDDGTLILVSAFPQFNNLNVFKDKPAEHAKDIVENLIKEGLNGGGFYKYLWKKPNTDITVEKIAYGKRFELWGWTLATGLYIDNLNEMILDKQKELDENVKSEIIFSILLFLVINIFIIIFSVVFTKSINSMFSKYKFEIENKNRELTFLNHSLELRVQDELKKRLENEQVLLQQSRLIAMGDMMVHVSHHWRQPLSVISLELQELETRIEYKEVIENDYLLEIVDKVLFQVDFLSKTITNFRTLFKESKNLISFDLRDAINDVLSFLNVEFKDNAIDFKFSDLSPDESYIIKGYLNEFKQVLINMLNNSEYAIKKREDNIKGEISITLEKDKDIKVSIIDNGIGIDSSIVEKIFDPYFTTKDVGEGTGLGLFTAKNIIERNMHGKLLVEVLDVGVKFEIIFFDKS